MVQIDTRGLSCPIPVVRVKDAIAGAAGEPLSVLADRGPASENITRFAQYKGYTVSREDTDDGVRLVLSPCQET